MRAQLTRLRTVGLAGHGVDIVVGLALISVCALLVPPLLALPSMAAHPVPRPVAALAGWASAVLAVHVGGEPSWSLFATARIRVRVVNLIRILVVATIGGALSACATGQWAVTTNSTMALLGWCLAFGGVLGHRVAWALPTLHLFGALVMGGMTSHLTAPRWTWIIAEHPGWADYLASATLLMIGCVTWLWLGNRQSIVQSND